LDWQHVIVGLQPDIFLLSRASTNTLANLSAQRSTMPTKKRKAPRRDDTDGEDWEPDNLAVRLKRGLMSPISPAASKARKLVSGKDRILNYVDENDSDEESIICLGGSSIPNDDDVFAREHHRGELIQIAQESSRVDTLFKALPIEVC
jgi:hypothetical protein